MTALLVEDNDGVRRIAVAFFKELGWESIAVSNGVEALTALEKRSDIALLFTDIILPGGISGLELARRVRVMMPSLKIVLTSGYPDSETRNAGLKGLGLPLIVKPYHVSTLEKYVGRADARHPPSKLAQ